MPVEHAADHVGYIPQVLGALGLGSSAIGMWIIKTSGRQARLEQKICDMEKRNDNDHQDMKDGLRRIMNHITNTTL